MAKCTPSIINATRSSPDRSAVQLGQGRFSHRHEAAGRCRLAYRRGCFSDLLPDWFEADRVAPRREGQLTTSTAPGCKRMP